jgi:hypothetical protein
MTCRRGSVLAASLGMALTACAQLTPAETAAPGTPVFAARQDSSSRFVGFVGPRAQHAPPFLNIPGTNFYCLRSFVDLRTGEAAHQLYVSDSYFGAERDWNAARDNAGRPLQFVQISSDEISCDAGCSYVEEFAAILPESELRASPGGLAVTFLSPSGDEKTIVISGDRIAAQLAAIDARRSPVEPAAARAGPAPPG